jgi:hypothetical protein
MAAVPAQPATDGTQSAFLLEELAMICSGSPRDSPAKLESGTAQLRIMRLFRANFISRYPDGIVIINRHPGYIQGGNFTRDRKPDSQSFSSLAAIAMAAHRQDQMFYSLLSDSPGKLRYLCYYSGIRWRCSGWLAPLLICNTAPAGFRRHVEGARGKVKFQARTRLPDRVI